jgi:hypothetical protein
MIQKPVHLVYHFFSLRVSVTLWLILCLFVLNFLLSNTQISFGGAAPERRDKSVR